MARNEELISNMGMISILLRGLIDATPKKYNCDPLLGAIVFMDDTCADLVRQKQARNRINPQAYKSDTDIGQYVTQAQVKQAHTTEDVNHFYNWMGGQTYSIVRGSVAYYIRDYERWLQSRKGH